MARPLRDIADDVDRTTAIANSLISDIHKNGIELPELGWLGRWLFKTRIVRIAKPDEKTE